MINKYSASYCGDDAWRKYVAAFKEGPTGATPWDERCDKDLFLSYFHDEDLAIVLAWHFDDPERAKAWFESTIPALSGARPKDLELTGLRSLIMQLPC